MGLLLVLGVEVGVQRIPLEGGEGDRLYLCKIIIKIHYGFAYGNHADIRCGLNYPYVVDKFKASRGTFHGDAERKSTEF